MKDALKGVRQLLKHRRHRRALARGLGAGGGAGAAQMVVDMVAHGVGLARDHLGQRAWMSLGLGQHDRKRRLQRVGQVADMGALALDHLLVVGDQGVQLRRQGLDLGRIVAIEPIGLAGAHGGHLALQREQRPQADAHLDQHHQDQADPEHDQADRRLQGEALG